MGIHLFTKKMIIKKAYKKCHLENSPSMCKKHVPRILQISLKMLHAYSGDLSSSLFTNKGSCFS